MILCANKEKTHDIKIEDEYRELCQDWRWRDKYVLDKLSAAGILFTLVGLALAHIPPEMWLVKLFLLFVGSFFSLILTISVMKDTYYRDGTEMLLRDLFVQSDTGKFMQTLQSAQDFENLDFPRKISIKKDKYSTSYSKEIPSWLIKWLLNRRTFRWILFFYLSSFVFFCIVFIFVLVSLIRHWVLFG